MDDIDLFARLGAALAIGLLVGVERGWKQRRAAERSRVAGLRTYSLIGLLGGVSGLLGTLIGPAAFAALAIGFALAWFGFKLWDVVIEGDPSVTGLVAGLIVFALGALAAAGPVEPALAAGVALTVVLAFKKALHAGLQRMSWEELRAGLLLLAASLVALPLLPSGAFGPFGLFAPRELWILTLILAGLSFLGHIGVRTLGATRGLTVTGLFGALVSSTAVTLDMARRSRGTVPSEALAGVAAGANAVMFARILLLLVIFAPSAWILAAPPLAVAALVSTAFSALFQWRAGRDKAAASPDAAGRPVDIMFVLQVAALLTLVTAATRLAAGVWGDSGIVLTAAIAGLVDVDAVTLAIAGLAREGLDPRMAASAAMVAALSATIAKAGLGAVFGSRRFSVRYLASGAISLLAAGGALWVFAR